ncbi:MAG: WG repeat-containing protein [Weeksellaceae bacterium]|nr:WG repeat-containing protein [Weeksellaceae bacterium]
MALATFAQATPDLLPALIPKKINQKFGYINPKGQVIIRPEYRLATFFSEDCNLLNSSNRKVRIYGSAAFATVEKDSLSYRINKKGIRVYQYKNTDLGKCSAPYELHKYKAFSLSGKYGLVSKDSIDLGGYKDFDIYPQYQMMMILESDRENPMIVAVRNNRFGIVDRQNKVIIPFVYADIKMNLSWKTAHLFEVSYDGKNYFFVDQHNKAY